ncbi:MAG: hypothetical protein ACOH13_09840 [Flavobacteriales bacterium]
MTVFLLTTLVAHGQTQKVPKSFVSKEETIYNLKKSVDQSWIKPNPSLTSTKSSFFNKGNESTYFIGLLQLSGQSVPFTWDDNLSLLQFLLSLDNEVHIKHGIEADENFKGTQINWKREVNGLIWIDNTTYKATIDNWHLFDSTDCPGTIIFPILSFRKNDEISNARTNSIQGLAIIPYIENIKIRRLETVIRTKDGQEIKGVGLDIDNDNIIDIFSYTEGVDVTTVYTRLYINVDGVWKCKWISLDEVCI